MIEILLALLTFIVLAIILMVVKHALTSEKCKKCGAKLPDTYRNMDIGMFTYRCLKCDSEFLEKLHNVNGKI